MTSSISSSEIADAAWRRWLRVFLAILVATGGAVYGLLVLIDPYDTGRFPGLGISGIADDSPRTANVSRGRDPAFNAAIFGTSTGQPLEPRRLSQLTGLSFVQLTVPGSTAREELTLLRWFVAHHRRIGALVIVSDDAWCESNPDQPLVNPFPFWLYRGDLEYLRNVLRPHSFELARRRVELVLGLLTPTDPTGYSDYEAGKVWNFHPPTTPETDEILTSIVIDHFPWIARLKAEIADVPGDVPVVVIVPPTFASLIPLSGTQAAAGLASCKNALASLVADRPHGGFFDYRLDDIITRDPKNFMDRIHYRRNISRLIEADIAATMLSAKAR